MVSVGSTKYELVIHADNLKDVATGWKVSVPPESTVAQAVQKFRDFRGQLFCPIGKYDEGKTFLINQIESVSLPSGFGNVTSAFSFITSVLNSNAVYLDTAGQKRTVASDGLYNMVSMEDRLATDQFIVDMVSYACDTVFYLVGPLQTTDVREINQMFDKRKLYHQLPNVFLIHNLYNMFRVEDIERHIKSDIVAAFNATQDSTGEFWRSHDGKMLHFVLGRQGAPSGSHFNQKTISRIQNIVKASLVNTDGQDVISKLTDISKEILREYFWVPGMDTNKIPFVISTIRVTIDDKGTKIVLPDDENMEVGLTQLFSSGQGYISSAACVTFGLFCPKQENQEDNEDDEQPAIHNPFSVIFDEAAEKLRLQNSSIVLKYLPFTGNRNKFSWTPDYDLFKIQTKKQFEWMLAIDVPGVRKEDLSVYCPPGAGGLVDNSRIRVTGMRTPPNYDFTEQHDTPFPRQYGTFDMEIKLPAILSCTSLHASDILVDGVLYLSSRADLLALRFSPDRPSKHKDEL